MVQMPSGIPVGVLAIGRAGATNAAILATQILARSRPELRAVLAGHRESQAAKILSTPDPSTTPGG
jgi:5-(carboxyamino)imidazole ribonucleotide mutase